MLVRQEVGCAAYDVNVQLYASSNVVGISGFVLQPVAFGDRRSSLSYIKYSRSMFCLGIVSTMKSTIFDRFLGAFFWRNLWGPGGRKGSTRLRSLFRIFFARGFS